MIDSYDTRLKDDDRFLIGVDLTKFKQPISYRPYCKYKDCIIPDKKTVFDQYHHGDTPPPAPIQYTYSTSTDCPFLIGSSYKQSIINKAPECKYINQDRRHKKKERSMIIYSAKKYHEDIKQQHKSE